jgi:Tol biopolymer transport system component
MRTPIAPIAAVLVTLLAVAAPAQATYPGRNGPILYDQLGDRQLFTIDPDGSNTHKLTHQHGVNHREASYTASGNRLVYVRGRDARLAIARADGTNVRVLHQRGLDPVPSPNGERIAFDNSAQIFSVGSDGAGLTTLTTRAAVGYTSDPTYSPDGSRVVFSCDANDEDGGLCSMAPDGSDLQTVYSSDTVLALHPNFAPNGRKVLVILDGPGAETAIASIGLADGDVQVIRSFGPSGREPIGRPAYSPSGKRIALTLAPSAASDDSDVWTMRADGSDLRRLTQTPGAHNSSRLDDWRPLP